MALFTQVMPGLQAKMDGFVGWSDDNFMCISAPKSKWMVFGPVEDRTTCLSIGEEMVERVEHFKYVGVYFTSTTRNIFAEHYHQKASKARRIANAAFAVESMVGCLPPKEGLQIYMARIDPLLTFGCEVVLDVDLNLLAELEAVQHLYLRRLLGLNSRSTLAVLFTETGIMPLRFRRVLLAVGYMAYILGLSQSHYARSAYNESLALARRGLQCWVTDLRWVVSRLPGPMHVELTERHFEDPDLLRELQKSITDACDKYLQQCLEENVKCRLLWGRQDGEDGSQVVRGLRHYLTLSVPAHRKAFTRLILSDHPLAVERLRYRERYRDPVPRPWRVCRFCRVVVEDEVHALLECEGDVRLIDLRIACRGELASLCPHLAMHWTSSLAFLTSVLNEKGVCARWGKYICDVFAVYYTAPIVVTSPYLYNPLT
jgi:hypothetical protein